eukprot:CAMPEP_0116541972 /NCGR_PEP_ID=MMETSP0397-20121206/764_1 /TAXON_ID=216820 /ORGANISM="Cyclophora tenuis, Strain ECT3854" /LENGTH=124 /DNA_ID=CAMNT_0004065943 /DNA_START=166 /DNA_END=540 /DNA_ORIENTATION=-
MRYIHQIKSTFRDQPEVYTRFEIEMARTTRSATSVDMANIIQRIYTLLESNEHLLLGFNSFLPPGYKIVVLMEDNVRLAAYSVPQEPNTRYILGTTQSQNLEEEHEDHLPRPVLVEPEDDVECH